MNKKVHKLVDKTTLITRDVNDEHRDQSVDQKQQSRSLSS